MGRGLLLNEPDHGPQAFEDGLGFQIKIDTAALNRSFQIVGFGDRPKNDRGLVGFDTTHPLVNFLGFGTYAQN